MEKKILEEFQELKNLTLLAAKQALTMKDAHLLTGLSLSHLYKLTSSMEIPHYKSPGGKMIYFDKTELTAWQLQHRVKTVDEIDTEAANYMITGKIGVRG